MNETFAAWVDIDLSGEAYVSQNKYFINTDLLIKVSSDFSSTELK